MQPRFVRTLALGLLLPALTCGNAIAAKKAASSRPVAKAVVKDAPEDAEVAVDVAQEADMSGYRVGTDDGANDASMDPSTGIITLDHKPSDGTPIDMDPGKPDADGAWFNAEPAEAASAEDAVDAEGEVADGEPPRH